MKQQRKKRNIYLAQVNNTYGKNAFLPYSVGLLKAYAMTIPTITEEYDFKEFIYLREPIPQLIRRMENPKVIGISCYIWNWSYSMALAKNVKEAFPNCLVILGGPHIPFRTTDVFFKKYDYADLLVQNEGEFAFSEILLEHLSTCPDYTKIKGMVFRSREGEVIRTPSRGRLNPNEIPSPYLSGVFDDLMKAPYDFHASQETHRGCPYLCSYCDWGSAVYSKVRALDTDRLIEEYEWFGKFKIDLLYNCDANYGLLPRDYELTEKLAQTKRKYGFPRKFRAAYAKNSNQKVYEIAKILHSVDMCKGVTLSFQSMDDKVLQAVERKNIKVTDFKQYMVKYRKDGIPTYSELIIGLPEETYESFASGIHRLIEGGQHDSLQVYNCEVLPNSAMNNPAYRLEYGIKTLNVPALPYHGTPAEDPHTEYYELVVETKCMSKDDWLCMHLYAWAIQCFHCLALTQYFSIFCYDRFKISYKNFYEKLLEFACNRPTTHIGRQYCLIKKTLLSVFEGKSWQIFDDRFGNIIWPLEEGAFLKCIAEKEIFYGEIENWFCDFVKEENLMLNEDVIKDLTCYQKNMIIDPFSPKRFQFSLNYNLHDYFSAFYRGDSEKLLKKRQLLAVESQCEYEGNLESYAREIVWYGRKGGKFRHTEVKVL